MAPDGFGWREYGRCDNGFSRFHCLRVCNGTYTPVMDQLRNKDSKVPQPRWMFVTILAFVASASGLSAARILNDRAADAVFIGHVLCDELVSITNVINAERGVYMISDVKIARVRVESVLNQDQPIPLRFPDEVLVHYNWYMRQAVQLRAGQRKKFYCDRGNVLGRTNVLVLVAASATP
jgi:hypothetical protein